MKNIGWLIIIWSLIFLSAHNLNGQEDGQASGIQIDFLPDLPPLNGAKESLGYAGMVGGIHNDVIIAAGGANFPDAAPWEGGRKVWSNAIHIFENNQWRISVNTLPIPLGYGASVNTDKGILCIGGNNENGATDSVILLYYDSSTKEVGITQYPTLPQSLAFVSAVKVGDDIYAIGGTDGTKTYNSFYRLRKEETKWEKLDNFPGPPRALHATALQETSDTRKIFVIGGRTQAKGQKSQLVHTYISYDLAKKAWDKETPILLDGKPKVIMGASAEAKGSMHILVYGGANGKLFMELEELEADINETQVDSVKKRLIKKRKGILENHPGFSNKIRAYNTITKKWFVYDSLSTKLPVTALSFKNKDDFVIVSGEISPGIRTPTIQKYSLADMAEPFGIINYTVLALYLLISLLIGFYFSYKQKSTEDYFVGGGRIPWWAAGLSVFGTLLSAITFMAIPAKAFITDWSFFFLNITAILITPLITLLFIPYFNKLNISTAYEFLEGRFNYLARAFGSLSFILFQVGRIGIVLLLPSLAISIVAGIPVQTSILIMGILCILYTTFGGIEAVIWTDVMQVIVLLGGSLLAVVWIMTHTETSFGEMITHASENDKFNIANMDLNFTESTFWVVFLGGLASAMVTQGTDQTIVQRYLTSTNLKDSKKTVYTNAVLTLPATIIFFGIGTLLFIFYTEMPEKLSPGISNNDSIFPWYIVRELPMGVSGLLVAGIFSAAMSSISSSLNSVSTAFCNDFYKHYRPTIRDTKLLKIARIATILTGVIGVLLALWMANSNIKSLWDQFYRFLGLFTGGLGGMFLLGMLTKKANAKGTLIGLVVSAVLIWYVSVFTEINFLLYSFFGVLSCFMSGYLFSILFKEAKTQ